MKFETKRLILRPWSREDAKDLYEFAKDPRVGPIAGWPVHTSVEDSQNVIQEVLLDQDIYAVTLKGEDKAIGSVGLMFGEKSNLNITENEAEIGYWIGVPFWGNGYIPEAVNELMNYAFETRGVHTLWCGYFDGNEKSKRAQEKCGFRYHHTEYEKDWPLMNDVRTEQITCITKEQWQFKRLFERLGNNQIMCLATSMENKVSARLMSVVIWNQKFYFQTDKNLAKYEQLCKNPNVALCVNNIQIEGICREIGHPLSEANEFFANLFELAYQGSYDAYSHLKEETVFEVTPVKISVWEYENERTYQVFYDFQNNSYQKIEYHSVNWAGLGSWSRKV